MQHQGRKTDYRWRSIWVQLQSKWGGVIGAIEEKNNGFCDGLDNDLAVVNTFFEKKVSQFVAYESGIRERRTRVGDTV